MSRSREVEVLILDTNPSIGDELNAAKDSLILHVQQKIVQMPSKSEIGLVAIGSADSDNNLALSKGGYENICEMRPITPVDIPLLKQLHSLEHGLDAGDWLDAVVVAMDMIIRHCEKKKYEKSIVMITNGGRPIQDVEQMDLIAQSCTDMNIRFRFYCIENLTSSVTLPSSSNDTLQKFIDQVGGEICSVSDEKILKGTMSRGSVTSQSVFRGILYISPKNYEERDKVGISVWAYTKTKQSTLPSLKKRGRDADGNTEEVGFVRNYVHEDDNTQEVDFMTLIKAHAYGREDVPVSKDDVDNIKIRGEKEMIVLGYMSSKEIALDQLMGNVDIIVPDRDGSAQMVTAFVAFATALKNRGDVAIVRWVRRANDAPKLYTVWAGMEGTNSCLYAIRHPFVEDFRPCPFPNLSAEKRKKVADQPGSKDDLSEAVDVFIQNADASTLEYRDEFNPVIQKFFELVNHKATEGLLDSTSRNNDGYCYAQMWGKGPASDAVNVLAKIVGRDPATATASTTEGKVKLETVDHPQIKGETFGDGAESNKNSLKLVGTSSQSKDAVDVCDPIAIFAKQWKEDAIDAHDTAIENIMKAVDQLVKTSPGKRFYERALNWLEKVRIFFVS
jgi:ATP-dependent DNA helicase 2 subunit 2